MRPFLHKNYVSLINIFLTSVESALLIHIFSYILIKSKSFKVLTTISSLQCDYFKTYLWCDEPFRSYTFITYYLLIDLKMFPISMKWDISSVDWFLIVNKEYILTINDCVYYTKLL